MSPLAQRIAIGEADGYILDPWPGRVDKPKTAVGWRRNGVYHSVLPDYLNDLNAIHEVEKMLFKTYESMGVSVYYDHLVKACDNNRALAAMATAAQRAEAFLRTLDLWDDTK